MKEHYLGVLSTVGAWMQGIRRNGGSLLTEPGRQTWNFAGLEKGGQETCSDGHHGVDPFPCSRPRLFLFLLLAAGQRAENTAQGLHLFLFLFPLSLLPDAEAPPCTITNTGLRCAAAPRPLGCGTGLPLTR